MNFQPTPYKLKNGISAIIRTANAADAQKLIDLKLSYIANTTSIPMTVAEYPKEADQESRLIADYIDSPNSILLVAEIDGTLVGNLDLTGSRRSKMYHTAMLGMGINEEWRNQGLGQLLVEFAIDWARINSPIELIWLNVYASNKSGYHLYEKMGFEASGTIPNFFKDRGEYDDKIEMYRRIKG